MDLWVFGYGSLIWNPGFVPAEQQLARLEGHRRSFCMRSLHYRGTEAAPGLVLALERQAEASCRGVAFRLPEAGAEQALADLRARELISAAYTEEQVSVDLADGRQVTALAYVIVPDHLQHASGLTLEEQAQIIARAAGNRGPNAEYLHLTVEHLATLGLGDAELDWLDARVRALSAVETPKGRKGDSTRTDPTEFS